jgi:hypothetical protein
MARSYTTNAEGSQGSGARRASAALDRVQGRSDDGVRPEESRAQPSQARRRLAAAFLRDIAEKKGTDVQQIVNDLIRRDVDLIKSVG